MEWVEVSVRSDLCQKGKVFQMVLRPAIMYDLEKVVLIKRQKVELEEAELKVLIA